MTLPQGATLPPGAILTPPPRHGSICRSRNGICTEIPVEIAGLSGDLLSSLTSDQLKLVEGANETIPAAEIEKWELPEKSEEKVIR